MTSRILSSRTHAVKAYEYSLLSSRLSVENLQGLLQRFNLLFTPCDSVFIADTRSNTCGLQLVEVSECSIKLVLGAFKILFLHGQSLVFILLLGGFVLDVGRLLFFIGR